jgi:hypothetical protein
VAAVAAEVFDVEWARQVLAEAIRRMKAECDESNRADVWDVFEGRVLRETIHAGQAMGYDELVRRWQFKSPAQAANVLITGKRMFARVLRGVVGEYARDQVEVEQEINDLRQILAHAGA